MTHLCHCQLTICLKSKTSICSEHIISRNKLEQIWGDTLQNSFSNFSINKTAQTDKATLISWKDSGVKIL